MGVEEDDDGGGADLFDAADGRIVGSRAPFPVRHFRDSAAARGGVERGSIGGLWGVSHVKRRVMVMLSVLA